MSCLSKLGGVVSLCAPGIVVSVALWGIRTFCLWRWQQGMIPKLLGKPSGTIDPLWMTCGLSVNDVERYGRQVILPKVGIVGQQAFLKARVLIVGAGGLGCPVALYLCAAGIGSLGIVDDDTVAVSNLHRQIAHSWMNVDEHKAISLRRACLAINGAADIHVYDQRLQELQAATDLVSKYDILVDCTDAPSSRYLMNDAAVAAGKPLVAASSVGLCGQLTIYNWKGGPCLRCVFPDAPSADGADMVASCEESGVLGPVPGVIGTLAAVETLKLLAGGSLAESCLLGRMLLYDAVDAAQPFRTMRIRKSDQCVGCSGGSAREFEYKQPCALERVSELPSMSAPDAATLLRTGQSVAVLDVRQRSHFAVSHLAMAENWPLPELFRKNDQELQDIIFSLASGHSLVLCVCRRGNDSGLATKRLREAGIDAWNLRGGLRALAECIQPPFEAPPLT